jgi:hypothetical protein
LAHSPIRPDADPEWEALHLAADLHRDTIRRALLLAFAALASGAVRRRIRDALRFGNLEGAMQAIPLAELWSLRSVLEDAFRRTAMAGARIGLESEMVVRLGSNAGLPIADLTFWARQRAAGLIAGITDQTRRAIRETIIAALEAGTSPAGLARLIEPSIGLNRVQARALRNRVAELVEAGLPAARRQAALERYAARLRRQRARVIARHELIQAANAGRRAVWTRDVRDGLIAPDRWEREWVAIVPSDGRTCRYCIGQDGQHAPINGAYPDGSSGPPGHVLCRCTEVLRRVA